MCFDTCYEDDFSCVLGDFLRDEGEDEDEDDFSSVLGDCGSTHASVPELSLRQWRGTPVASSNSQ